MRILIYSIQNNTEIHYLSIRDFFLLYNQQIYSSKKKKRSPHRHREIYSTKFATAKNITRKKRKLSSVRLIPKTDIYLPFKPNNFSWDFSNHTESSSIFSNFFSLSLSKQNFFIPNLPEDELLSKVRNSRRKKLGIVLLNSPSHPHP
jgi:hypothetical protein